MPIELLVVHIGIAGRAMTISHHASLSNGALLFGEELGIGRGAWHEDEGQDTKADCHSTFNEEDPWPAIIATGADLC